MLKKGKVRNKSGAGCKLCVHMLVLMHLLMNISDSPANARPPDVTLTTLKATTVHSTKPTASPSPRMLATFH